MCLDGGEATDANTIVLRLEVECKHKAKPRADAVTPDDKYDNAIIYSRDLRFVPQGNQTETVSYMCKHGWWGGGRDGTHF